MPSVKKTDSDKHYHFEFKHLTVLFIILISFQIIVSFINKSSILTFLNHTQEWYQKDSAEKIANLTTTSLELILENINPKEDIAYGHAEKVIQSINIIFSQQVLQHNIEELCLIVNKNGKLYAIDGGNELYYFIVNGTANNEESNENHKTALTKYVNIKKEINSKEQIFSYVTDEKTFHTFVPFILKGEFIGALYMRNTPDFSFITNQISSNFDETSLIYISLILLGLLAMYFISSYTVKERDEAQNKLFLEHEDNIKKEITHEKELAFTKRIYHTHHKAEKIMGFIKEDLGQLSADNIEKIKYRVSKYSNFVSRVIYDMKWFEPPVQTVRNMAYKTNLNEVLQFIIDNIFLRVSDAGDIYIFNMNLDPGIPNVFVNEYVAWELFEPLVQNSIDHAGITPVKIDITSRYFDTDKITIITISDNGKGILPELLKEVNGVKKIFLENITTKTSTIQNSGYGSFIAYQISKRCGWDLDVANNETGGCKYTVTINNN